MKKITAILMIMVLTLGLCCGCGKDGQQTNTGTENTVDNSVNDNKTDVQTSVTQAAVTEAPDNGTTVADEISDNDNVQDNASDSTPVLKAEAPASADGNWSGMTAEEIVAEMGTGFNLGNTFDATGGANSLSIYAQEQSWGNPKVTPEQIKTIADAGFKTIRIPITWMNQINVYQDYQIKQAWLERIAEVVGYAYDCGLVVIINVHHEDWVNRKDLGKAYEEVGKELKAVWEQISTYFADFDQHLIFEVMNEPRSKGAANEWSGDAAAYDAVNYLNDIAVNVIRGSHEGHNDERAIMIPGYAASSSTSVMSKVVIPEVDGTPATNIIASVHGYTPYNFCLSDAQKDFDLNNTSHTGQIDNLFEGIYRTFIVNGIPAVLGETGATNSGNNTEARENWAYYMSMKGAEYGVPVVLWDNGATGTSGGECHAFLNRKLAGEWFFPTVIDKLISGAQSVEWGSRASAGSGAAGEGNDIIWSDENGRQSTAEYDMNYILMISYPSYYPEGGSIEVTFTGAGEPKLMVDSEVKMQWWMPVDPDSVTERDGKKVATFSTNTILGVMSGFGVTDFSDLRNCCVLATNGGITTYEVKVVR